MAMLAEPKRKRKWSLNPRGKAWSNDTTHVGHKLLEKMGWSKGKGLGREEQGDLEPIRLKYKNDSEGVGYEAKDDQWVAHREQFNQILESLNGSKTSAEESETAPNIHSLEARSKSSKARVHYHKFTRGKDLSRYSASDLDSILGKRSTVNVQTEVESKEEEETVSASSGTVEHLHGVTTIHGGSIQEYFAAKMAAAKENQLRNSKTDSELRQENTDSNEENEKRVRINEELNVVKEFCSKQKILDLNREELVEGEVDEVLRKKKKKSKNKLKEGFETNVIEGILKVSEHIDSFKIKYSAKESCDDSGILETGNAVSVKERKSKKRKIEENGETIIAVNGDHNLAEEPKKKKKKKTSSTEVDSLVATTVNDSSGELSKNEASSIEESNLDEIPRKKSKKNKKNRDGDLSENSETNCDTTTDNQEVTKQEELKSDGNPCDLPPKKKKKKSSKNEETQPIVTSQEIQDESVEKLKKKKKKSENHEDKSSIPTLSEDDECKLKKDSNESEKRPSNSELVPVDSDEVKKSKKKKKKNKDAEEVPEKYTKIEDSFVEIDSQKQEIISKCEVVKNIEIEPHDNKKASHPKENLDKQEKTKGENTEMNREHQKQPNSTKAKSIKNKYDILHEEKAAERLKNAQFEKFKGANILDIVGYNWN